MFIVSAIVAINCFCVSAICAITLDREFFISAIILELPKDRLEWESHFLRGDEEVDVTSYGDEVLGVLLPAKVVLKVVETEPAVRGDTVNKAMKEATLETGLKVRVPLFIEQGEEVYVRTDNGNYDGRAN